jgi:predicted ATPase/class 3 adenylate cyclase
LARGGRWLGVGSVAFVPERPSGTVSLMFTDIEGSTRLWEEHPAEMQIALARHDELVRSIVENADGYVFKTVGDAFCVAFATAREAVGAAVEVQRALVCERWPEPVQLRVRIAVHSGECTERGGDYFGPTVNRLARLEAVAHGGQVALSAAATELIGGVLPEGVVLRDLGQHRLKDLTAPEHVFQLDIDGLSVDFPPLRSLTNPALRHNLPRYASSFVGRTAELIELQALVGHGRLVTLVGAGGCGKTRLAVQVAAELLDGSGDGVWLVEFAALADGTLVAATLAAALGLRPEPPRPVIETLVNSLRSRRMLIVLDNCEHVINEAAQLADILLSECPTVALVATSREPLRVAGEQLYRVASLGTPPEGSPVDTIVSADAVRLFAERARSQQPDFRVDETNAAPVSAICRQLDGIPLAIELAAARLPSLSLVDIAERLRERFRLLTTGPRTVLPRQQTLRALIDWSYDLLNDDERLALCRLATFVGGCAVDAAEAVVADGDRMECIDVLDVVSALTDKSLLGSEPNLHGTRYIMLETVRQYAMERLSELGDEERIGTSRRHRDYYLALAEQASAQLSGPNQAEWFERLAADLDNLRAALTFTLDDPDRDDEGLRFLVSLGLFWERGGAVEGLRYASALLDRTEGHPSTDRWAAALTSTAPLHIMLGQSVAARRLLDQALTIAETGDDYELINRVLCYQGFVAQFQFGELDAARACYARSLALAQDRGDARGEMFAIKGLADVLAEEGDERSRTYYEQALTTARTMNDLRTMAVICCNQSMDEHQRGNLDAAEQLATEALTLSRELHLSDLAAGVISLLGTFTISRLTPSTGDAQRVELLNLAKEYCLEAFDIARRTYNLQRQAHALKSAASVAYHASDPLAAVILYGTGDAITDQRQLVWEQFFLDTRTAELAAVREILDPADFDAAYQSGRTLSLADAITVVQDIKF